MRERDQWRGFFFFMMSGAIVVERERLQGRDFRGKKDIYRERETWDTGDEEGRVTLEEENEEGEKSGRACKWINGQA